MKNILTITTEPDVHLDMVRDELVDDHILVFDPATLTEDQNLSLEWEEGKLTIGLSDRELSNCKSVWYRKPDYLSEEDFPVEPAYLDLCKTSYDQILRTLYTVLDERYWMSDYWAIQKARLNKVYQIKMANSVGLLTPRTLVSTNPLAVERFIEEQGSCIAKPLGLGGVKELGFVFTSRVKSTDGLDYSGVGVSPMIIQEEIVNVADTRVTVVGDQVFPCEITKQGALTDEVDYRYGSYTYDVAYGVDHEFPDEMKARCVQLVRKMGLSFSALDFVKDDRGNYWFLECNSNGQWAFVEIETGLPIAQAIARSLSNSQ